MAYQMTKDYNEEPEMLEKAIPFGIPESNGRHESPTFKPLIKLIVKYGNIERQMADVLSTPLSANNPSLGHLNVNKALKLAAGDSFTNLFNSALNNRNSLEPGRLFEMTLGSDSYSIKFKYVFFIPLNNWTYPTSSAAEAGLRRGMKNLLERCNIKNVESIAMSAIGTGIALAFPPVKAATITGEEIKSFVEGNPNTNIKELHFVIKQLLENEIIFIAYRETLAAMDFGGRVIVCDEQGVPFRKTQLGDNKQKQIGDLSVFVVYRDIVDETTHAIVNSTNFKKWKEDSVAHAIFSKTGKDIVQEAQRGHIAGNKIVMTGPGNLKCNWVLHCDCGGNLDTVRHLIDELFTLCGDTGITSLSIPAIGTGEGSMCPKSVAQTMMEAISVLARNKKRNPSVVRLVTYTPFIYNVFCIEFQKHF